MSLYMESTKISAERTAHEISNILIQAGASAIRHDVKEKKICGLSFTLEIKGDQVPFTLPVRIEPIFRYLQKRISPRNRDRNKPAQLLQAERVAWRQLLRWIQAQVALIDTGMVKADEVFLPYIQTGVNETLYERLSSCSLSNLHRLALPSGNDNKIG
jgi:hypothetical protein